MKKIDLDRDKLYDLYIVQRKSTKEIAIELGIGKNTVNRHLKRNNIPIRDKNQAIRQAMEKWGDNKKAQNVECHLKCENCGKDIYKRKSHIDKAERHFCSIKCSTSFYGSPRKKTGEVLNCTNCGKEFYRNKYNVENFNNHFCSKECHNEWMATEENIGELNPKYKRRQFTVLIVVKKRKSFFRK